MKICLTTPYYIPIKGGISNYILHLSINLATKGQETYIITNRGVKDAENVYVCDSSKIYFIFKALKQIRNLRPDVIHSHAQWYMLAPCIIYKLFNPRTMVLHTFHTDPVEKSKGLKRIALKILFSRCDVLTFVSKYLRNKIMENFDINVKTEVIYGGVSSTKVEKEEIDRFKNKFNLRNYFPIISFVGVLSWKMKAEGVKVLIQAYKQVLEKLPYSCLLIVGDGEYRKEIECFANELDIGSQIIFTGFVDNAMIPLTVSDIYTHISFQEGGVSLAVIEAMSLGKPVIASRIGGIPELINVTNGILVSSEPAKIAREIIELVEDKDKATYLSENAIKTVQKNFTWDTISTQFIRIYRGQ